MLGCGWTLDYHTGSNLGPLFHSSSLVRVRKKYKTFKTSLVLSWPWITPLNSLSFLNVSSRFLWRSSPSECNGILCPPTARFICVVCRLAGIIRLYVYFAHFTFADPTSCWIPAQTPVTSSFKLSTKFDASGLCIQ